jgi:hypothetical protein
MEDCSMTAHPYVDVNEKLHADSNSDLDTSDSDGNDP